MNKTQAIAAMLKLVGKRVNYRYDESAPKAEEREELHAKLPALQAARDATRTAMDQRIKDLLAGDAEYQRLRAEAAAARKAAADASSRARHYRVTIGDSSDGFCNLILAEGDNWQDAIDKLKIAVTRTRAR
jgi:hypothetical protein